MDVGNVEKAWRKDGATTNDLASFQTSGISAVRARAAPSKKPCTGQSSQVRGKAGLCDGPTGLCQLLGLSGAGKGEAVQG